MALEVEGIRIWRCYTDDTKGAHTQDYYCVAVSIDNETRCLVREDADALGRALRAYALGAKAR